VCYRNVTRIFLFHQNIAAVWSALPLFMPPVALLQGNTKKGCCPPKWQQKNPFRCLESHCLIPYTGKRGFFLSPPPGQRQKIQKPYQETQNIEMFNVASLPKPRKMDFDFADATQPSHIRSRVAIPSRCEKEEVQRAPFRWGCVHEDTRDQPDPKKDGF